MAKHHLLCVHGIGKHPDDWVHQEKIENDRTFAQLFREQFAVMFPERQFEDYFELHSIAYDPEIEKILDQWQTTLATLTTDLSHIGDLPKSVDWYKQYAKKSKETAVEEFIESRQRLASGIELTYYLPASAVDAGDTVLVVDDLIRSGETQELLLDIALQAAADVTGRQTLSEMMDGFERSAIISALNASQGSIKDTMVHLGIARKTLYDKMRKHGLDKAEFKD